MLFKTTFTNVLKRRESLYFKKTNFWSRLILFKRSKYSIWLIWENRTRWEFIIQLCAPTKWMVRKEMWDVSSYLILINWPVPFLFPLVFILSSISLALYRREETTQIDIWPCILCKNIFFLDNVHANPSWLCKYYKQKLDFFSNILYRLCDESGIEIDTGWKL